MAEQLTLEQYKRAYMENRLAEEKTGFYFHLAAFVIVNAMLIAINYFYTPTVPWAIFPLGGWVIGLVAHYIGVFRFAKKNLERKEAEAEYSARLIHP